LGGAKVCFRRDPVTLLYAYDAVKKIKNIVSKLPNVPIKTFVDVGANNGWFTYCIANVNPGVRSYLIEPNPNLLQAIETNCKAVNTSYSIHDIGISNVSERTIFNIATENAQQSSLFRDAIEIFSSQQPIRSSEIVVTTLDEFCREHNISSIDLLKVDIQGAEHLLLQGASAILPKTKMAIFEISFIEPHAVDVFRKLVDAFGSYKVVASVSYGADILFYRTYAK